MNRMNISVTFSLRGIPQVLANPPIAAFCAGHTAPPLLGWGQCLGQIPVTSGGFFSGTFERPGREHSYMHHSAG